jgi:Subtilisin inhibitor-like
MSWVRRRTTMTWRALLLLPVAVLALAACSDGDGNADVAVGSPQPSPGSEETPPTSLTIIADNGDGSAAQEWTLTCDPAGGSHPDPAAACEALGGLDPTVFAPVAPDQACTQIYGGPETATVRGSWNGTPLDASFSRDNGCEIARWEAVQPLFGAGST